MDLSFARFDRRDEGVMLLPVDLAVLLVRIAARQAASPTAMAHARMMPEPSAAARFAPLDGAFHGGVAHALADWKIE